MKISKDIVPIIDLHTCIQGEGKLMGVPHILIRFSGCNMNCQFSDWICDTAYASWKPEQGKYSLWDIKEILENNTQIKHSFITGGEPTTNIPLLKEVVKILKFHNHYVTIETNGTNAIPPDLGIDLVSMSPKLKNSIPIPGTPLTDGIVNRVVTEKDRDKHEKSRTNYAAMINTLHYYPNTQLKFVVTEEEQLTEIMNVQTLLGIENKNVYLMPEGITPEQLQKRRAWIIELCIKHGYKFSDRLHIIAYGNKREA